MKPIIIISAITIIGIALTAITNRNLPIPLLSNSSVTVLPSPTPSLFPLAIESMRQNSYPGSPITIESTLAQKPLYAEYLASYFSDGYKIYALLTVPTTPTTSGYPAIVFNHGYIPPEIYKTTEKYIAYVDALAKAGFVVFKIDYRGHGQSEGKPEGAYYSTAYTKDALNAVASLQQFDRVDPDRIGMWGHSMGGHITLRSMVVSPHIKAGVIWGGVVASYEDMMTNWHRSRPWQPSNRETAARRPSRQEIIDQFGDPKENPQFWQSISPIYHVESVSGPIQIHHGLADDVVPYQFSESLHQALIAASQTVEYYSYNNGDHNLSDPDFTPAMTRTIDFFTKYL